ncbi:MAG TPA: prolipoprotein diacylglyceryl transferase [Marmoricola sp.]|jgi:prolipoprotein diacylglyceryl transferase|nr:prolipoprotein diacylglyceryl transferase [Marmoricola sp.]
MITLVIPHLAAQFIPSPSQGVWHIGSIPLRAYAFAIILGVVAAVWLGEKRWVARGGIKGQVGDVALWGVPFGLVGARAYSVATDSDRYFGHGVSWFEPFAVWHGGLGIWGAIAGGVLGGFIACRQYGIKMRPMLDALAPALLLAQAIGRWGNYFNQELYGRPTKLPWGLKIDQAHWAPPYDAAHQPPTVHAGGAYATFHPTFLYESIWDLGAMGVVLWLDRRLKLGFGRCFALYVAVYCVGRGWIEYLRIDSIEHHIWGLRLNDWTAIILFVLALGYFVIAGRKHPAPDTREEAVFAEGREPSPESGQEAPGSGQPDAEAGEAVPAESAPDPGETTP